MEQEIQAMGDGRDPKSSSLLGPNGQYGWIYSFMCIHEFGSSEGRAARGHMFDLSIELIKSIQTHTTLDRSGQI